MALSAGEILKFYGGIEPFKSLSPQDLRQIVSQTRERSFSRGETVYNEGDPADSVWVLFGGRIRVLKYTSEGRPFAIESLSRGELFGTLCRMGGGGRTYPCTAVASAPSVVFQLLDRTFLEYYMKSPGMVRGICSLCSERLKDVQGLRCMGQESVPVRVAAILLRLYQVHGATIPFTKKEIAELSGTTLETTFRTLAQFQKKTYLASLRGKICIKKPDLLKNIVEKV